MSDYAHPAALPTAELLQQCRIWRQRRSGPGGQHRNKVETAIFIEHLPTGVRAEASERRSQEQNRRAAVARLRVQLALAVRSPLGAVDDYDPSPVWRMRLGGRRIDVSGEHEDFPALLAEALDVTAAADFDVPKAAVVLGTTTSQLVKFFAQEQSALALVNAKRRDAELRPYKSP
jgi:hypothetical protein